MVDRRKANIEWLLGDTHGENMTWEQVHVAVLMDIRRELRRLNSLLHCPNATAIPQTLREIRAAVRKVARNTTKKKKPKA